MGFWGENGNANCGVLGRVRCVRRVLEGLFELVDGSCEIFSETYFLF